MTESGGEQQQQQQEEEEEVERCFIRSYELRLLRCTLPPPSSSSSSQPSAALLQSHHLHSLISQQLLPSIESANYLHVLHAAAQSLSPPPANHSDSVQSAELAYSEFLSTVDSFLANDDDNDTQCRVIVVMCIAVAAFLIFTQSNLTGPSEQFPKCPLQFKSLESKQQEFLEWDNWARNQLMEAGSDLLGKFSSLQYLVFAKLLLMRIKDFLFKVNAPFDYEIRSVSWWLARVLLLQQRILDERSSLLFDSLQVFTGEALQHFGRPEDVASYWGQLLTGEEASNIVSMIHLEAGIMEYAFGRIDPCRSHFESAELSSGLQLSVTGVLGYRTVHQVDPKAQMVLVSHKDSIKDGNSCPSNRLSTHDLKMGENNLPHHQSAASETSDVLLTPKLLANGSEHVDRAENIKVSSSNANPLKEIQQAVVLAQCLLIEKSTRQDEMQRWDMAPYIEAIDSQQASYFIIRCFCDILRIRWESNRGRTRERALLMMEKLVQGISEPFPEIAQRILFCYGVYMPTIPALRKEYGEFLVRFGLIGEAVKIFEDLELWDNLILCYRLMEKKAAAVDLIKKRLSEAPNDPRLWCSLGDVTNDDLCYEKALEVSDNKSARAKRSLARSAYNRGDYKTSQTLWESAMALNSLYPDGWFALGAAALKARDIEKALDGFTRAVQLDPENGEAWNNIACLHMVKKKSKEAFVAFKEALKLKRNSWQMWENYSHVALDVGNIGQTLEAIKMVLELSRNKRVETEFIMKVLLEIETKEHANGKSRETEHLVELLGKVLQQIVKSGGEGDVWGLYARWHKMKGDLTMCSEALLKQVRSYQGSELWKDIERFKKFARASLELCKVYMEISASSNSRRELCTAEMHIKNILRQAGTFSETEEFRELQTCFDEVKMRLQTD